MEKIIFIAFALLSFTTVKASTDWSYYDGTANVKADPDGDPGCYILSCHNATTLCCAVDNQTGFVVVNNMAMDINGNPTPGNRTLIGNYAVSSLVENPDQQTTVEMSVSNLTVCDNCDNIISGWSGN